MGLRRDALLGTLSLLALIALIAFGTIGLIGRMRPALSDSLTRNVVSLAAGEDAMQVLARAGGAPLGAREATRYTEAIDTLAAKITEPKEAPLTAQLLAERPAVIAGEAPARRLSVRALGALLEVNHAALRHADQRAQQLGVAGAWAVVFLSLVAVLIGYVALRALDRRLLFPVAELRRVLTSATEGEPHRRLGRHTGSKDFDAIFEDVNALLDRQIEVLGSMDDPETKLVRMALAALLDERAEPTFVVEEDGAVLAANQAGLAALAGEGGGALRDALRQVERLAEAPHEAAVGLEVAPIAGAPLYLCCAASSSMSGQRVPV